MKQANVFIWMLLIFCSCSKSKGADPVITLDTLEIKAADMSFLPEVRAAGLAIKNAAGQPEDMLQTLKHNGATCIRLRLWKDPATGTSSFNTVKALSQEIKSLGMKVWISVHYSDTWADPGSQIKPAAWNGISFNQLKDSVFVYTQKIAREISPEYIQIGNEINNGFLYPEGSRNNLAQMKELIAAGTQAVRTFSPASKIMLHCAGYDVAEYFFSTLQNIDYDIMAVSYYPLWHGKNLNDLKTSLTNLSNINNKPVVIAETAYPFTFGYNDYTNNVIGDNSQIISTYPASIEGQKNFLSQLKSIVNDIPRGAGFCYWGAEWVSLYGATSTAGSSWENQALWGFDNKALPAIHVFKD
ncbi:MAG: glycosyl hydrolase 53 family protein [Rhizobacter sp.]|nr:glycosyl hydrolase 53 family protein [Ferruginibacter sp.]